MLVSQKIYCLKILFSLEDCGMETMERQSQIKPKGNIVITAAATVTVVALAALASHPVIVIMGLQQDLETLKQMLIL